MWKQVRSVHERSLVTRALIHAYFPSSGEGCRRQHNALSRRSTSLMTVFMLTHTGRVPSFQLLIAFGHRWRPEISLPPYQCFASLQRAVGGGGATLIPYAPHAPYPPPAPRIPSAPTPHHPVFPTRRPRGTRIHRWGAERGTRRSWIKGNRE